MKIVLFEDDPDTGPRLRSEIENHIPRGSSVVLFEAGTSPKLQKIKLYEERLAEEVKSVKYRGATLWVSDRDLSRIARYEGLSEAVISKVAFQYGMPLCKYARGVVDDVLKRQRSWGDAQIVLGSKDLSELGEHIAIVGKGFEQISKELRKLMPGQRVRSGIRTPADVMARLLGHPCQSAFKFDPVSASNFDPFERRVLAVALAPSELVGVAETVRARVV
jgi:hypothetical protein